MRDHAVNPSQPAEKENGEFFVRHLRPHQNEGLDAVHHQRDLLFRISPQVILRDGHPTLFADKREPLNVRCVGRKMVSELLDANAGQP